MRRHGWSTTYRFEDGSAFEHAQTMGHRALAPVDVHRRFPGLGDDAEAAFEMLWADRHDTPIAGYPLGRPVRDGPAAGTDPARGAWRSPRRLGEFTGERDYALCMALSSGERSPACAVTGS